MEIIKTGIEGVLILKPRIFSDSRGYFFENYTKRVFDALVTPTDFVQDNESLSCRGVMRGLHFQAPPLAQAKLVRCASGHVVDIAVDIRRGSPTYGHHVAVELDDREHLQVFIPRGFAHGFAVLSDSAIIQYKCDNYYSPEHDGGISIMDTELGIKWPFAPDEAIISDKDTRHPLFRDFVSPFTFDRP